MRNSWSMSSCKALFETPCIISSCIAVRAARPGSLIGGNTVADTVCCGPAGINRPSVTSYISEGRSKNNPRNNVVSLTSDDGWGSKLINSKEESPI
jgi:hypothetical protein